MDFLLAKMAAKSTGNTSPYYPLMLKPGTVYIPEPPRPGDAETKPDIDNTSTMTSSSGITEVLPVRTRTLPMDSAPIHQSWMGSHSTNQNQDHALAIVNDDIEVQAEFRIRWWLATK